MEEQNDNSEYFKILTSQPHSEEDIIAYKPIRFKYGNIVCKIPLFSFVKLQRFENGLKLLGLSQLTAGILENEEIQKKLEILYEDSPALKLWDPYQGLTYFIFQFVEPADRDKAREYLQRWADNNPTATKFKSIDSDIKLKWAMIDYFNRTMPTTAAYKLFRLLALLQRDIKKKLAQILTEEAQTEEEREEPPKSPASRAVWESRRKKRSNLRLISSS